MMKVQMVALRLIAFISSQFLVDGLCLPLDWRCV